MRKKDLILSVLGHLILTGLILVINPAMGMFKPKMEIMVVKPTDFFPGGPPPGKPDAGPKSIAPPKPAERMEDETITEKPKLKSENKKEKIIAEKPKEKPPKAVEKSKEETRAEESEAESAAQDEAKSEQTVKEDGKGGLEVASTVGGSGTGVGPGSSNLPYNLGLVLNIIERNWRNPVTSPKPITCTVYFQIDRSGRVIGEPVVEKSSGYSTFDQAAVLAILRAGQFPAFPSSFNYAYIGLHLDFQYVPGK